MIRYSLICDKAHEFDGWFAGSDAFDKQVELGLVECAVCGSTKVSKALMTPGVPAKSNRKSDESAAKPEPALHVPDNPKLKELAENVRKLRKHVEANADYVGDKFADEARAMHYGEEEPRGIYGETSLKEAAELHEEGVEVMPLPKLPDDAN